MPFLSALLEREFDRGNAHYPPNVRAGLQQSLPAPVQPNVIPAELTLDFNFRYSNEQTAEGLKSIVESLLAEHGVDATLSWQLSGEPFLTPAGTAYQGSAEGHRRCIGRRVPALYFGRYRPTAASIAPHGCEVVELGPVNATIHKVNECVAVADLEPLAEVYERILEELLGA